MALVKSETVVVHIMKGKTGRLAKKIFYILKGSMCHKYYVAITDETVNSRDLKGVK